MMSDSISAEESRPLPVPKKEKELWPSQFFLHFFFLQSYLNAHTLLARKKALVDIECALESGRGMLLF